MQRLHTILDHRTETFLKKQSSSIIVWHLAIPKNPPYPKIWSLFFNLFIKEASHNLDKLNSEKKQTLEQNIHFPIVI